MKIGLVQMNSRSEKEENLQTAERLINTLADNGADLIMLPEYSNFIGPEKLWPANAESLNSSLTIERMRKLAMSLEVNIHIGSLMERQGENIYNTGVVLNRKGEDIAHYRKIHLFDVEVPGGRRYLESDKITPGEEIVTFTLEDVTFGMATCYDLRFPELFRALASQGAQVLLLPAAFTLMTGKDHWELLLRARAVENLCWVAAAGQFGHCPPNHTSFGRSMIIDPWGVVISQASDGETIIIAEIDIDVLEKIRQKFPALQHRRDDIFT